jgi:cyclopropane fatty-acyl-phospholipid synthase-like methyltransferase
MSNGLLKKQVKVVQQDEYKGKSQSYYDERFGNLEKGKTLNSEELRRLNEIRSALKNLNLKPEKTKILDFGCGRGWLSNELKDLGTVYGIDLSEEAVKGASELYPKVTFAAADLSVKTIEEVFPGIHFDVLVSSEVIEHVLDQDAYLKNAFQALGSDGTFILTTPNGDYKTAYFDGDRKEWGQPYEFWLKPIELEAKFKSAGFNVISQKIFNATWLLQLVIYKWNWMKFYENRLLRSWRYRFKKEESYLRWIEKNGLGLYQIILARKK